MVLFLGRRPLNNVKAKLGSKHSRWAEARCALSAGIATNGLGTEVQGDRESSERAGIYEEAVRGEFHLGPTEAMHTNAGRSSLRVSKNIFVKLSRYTSLCILHRNSTLNSAVTSTTKWSSYNVTEATAFAKRASIDARILRIFMKKSQIAMLQRSHAQSAGTNLSIIFMVH